MARLVSEAAREIPGWMADAELEWLADQASRRPVIVEVGSWQGRSTKALASTGAKVWAVDDLSGQNGSFSEQADLFERNLSVEMQFGRVEVLHMSSVAASRTFPDGFADMVFIDANHDYPFPLMDMLAWERVLKPSGLLCGHDADLPGVARSLEEFGSWRHTNVGSIWGVDA